MYENSTTLRPEHIIARTVFSALLVTTVFAMQSFFSFSKISFTALRGFGFARSRHIFLVGSFNNYLDKERWVGVQQKIHSLSREQRVVDTYVKCPQLSTRGGRWSKQGKIWSTQLLNDPLFLLCSLNRKFVCFRYSIYMSISYLLVRKHIQYLNYAKKTKK